MTIVYKIRRKSDGLFSTGGITPRFTEKGKEWKARNHVSSHMRQVGFYHSHKTKEEYYSDCEVVTYKVTVAEIESIPALNWEETAKTKRTKQLAEQRRALRELAELTARKARLEEELAAVNSKMEGV